MPGLTDILAQLGVQQPSGNPASGQARYDSGWSAFAAGLSDYTVQQNAQTRGRVQSTRDNLLKMVQSIPDSETNAPMKLKLIQDLLQAGDKHWSDKVLAPNKADDMVAQMYKLFQDKLPQQQALPTMAPPGEGMSFGIGAPGALPGGGAGASIPPPVDNTGRFQFQDPGKWKDVNEVFQDEETGDKYLMQIDQATGKSKRIGLGKAKTVSEINAEVRSRKAAEMKRAAVSKNYYDKAVALYGAGPEQFDALSPEVQALYYGEAGKMVLKESEAKMAGTTSRTELNKSATEVNQVRIPQIQAQTEATKLGLDIKTDPATITADEVRTNNALLQTVNEEIKQLQKITANPRNYLPKEVKAAKERLEALLREREAVRNRILKPQQRLNPQPPTGARGGRIPSGSSGPIQGQDPNDPEGLFPYLPKRTPKQ